MKKNFIFGRFFRLTVAACAVLALGACKSNETKTEDGKPVAETRKDAAVRTGYACCNLHYSGDWISDSNLAQLPFIPVGTPIRVLKIDGYRASIDVDGKAYRLGHDFGRAEETTEQWVNKIVVLDDPKAKIAKFSPAVRGAIEKGQLMKGMTKEQVIMSVGHPQTNENPRLDGPYWRYWWSSFGPYYVYWGKGSVSKIDGHSETVGYMTYKGK
ncbi:MAG: hypothetical protein H6R14_1274 [Proteobacteria bacterium]|nr:hypothetical protein [Pseudomonadota bacterium]